MTDGQFPALSVRQPWAELIICGRKPMEIRTWEHSYRGRIWIHAGRHVDEELDRHFGIMHPDRGAYVGSAELSSIEILAPQSWEDWRKYHLSEGAFRPGLLAWVLSRPRRLTSPVPAAGNVGLYKVDAALHARLVGAELA